MFVRTAASSRARWSVGMWALLLSITAGALAAVLGIHALGDNAFAGGAQAVSSVSSAATVTVAADSATTAADARALVWSGEVVASGVAGSGEVLACSLLALLCAATVAFVLARLRHVVARALDPAAAPEQPGPATWFVLRSAPVSLTVLGISRI